MFLSKFERHILPHRFVRIRHYELFKNQEGNATGKSFESTAIQYILYQLDKYLKSKGLKFVRYADEFSVYTKSKAEALKIGNEVYLFLKHKLDLPINREKSGMRRPNNFELLGHSFVPVYKKGEKGKYQLVVKKGSWGNLKRKLKAITKKTLPYSFEERLQKFKEVWMGSSSKSHPRNNNYVVSPKKKRLREYAGLLL